MKKLLVIITVIAAAAGCATISKPAFMGGSPSVQTQQAHAEQAQAEMEKEINNGAGLKEPSSPPVQQPVMAAPQAKEPSGVMPPKTMPKKLGSLTPQTKYPLKDGYPVWFFTPVYDGYIGAVGIAPKQNYGGISAQRRVAVMQAQKNLAKQIKVLVTSNVKVESLGVDSATVQHYRTKVSSLTREQVDQYLTGYKVMDEWVSPKTGEYYIWMVLEK